MRVRDQAGLPRRDALDRLWQCLGCKLAAHFSARSPGAAADTRLEASLRAGVLNVCLKGKPILVEQRVAEFPQQDRERRRQRARRAGKNLSSCAPFSQPGDSGRSPASATRRDLGQLRQCRLRRPLRRRSLARAGTGRQRAGGVARGRTDALPRAPAAARIELEKTFGRVAENTRCRNNPGIENFNGQFERIGFEPRRPAISRVSVKESVETVENRQIGPRRRFSPQSSNALRRSLAVVRTQGRDHLVGQGDLVRIEERGRVDGRSRQ
jgi:hypothetical protein